MRKNKQYLTIEEGRRRALMTFYKVRPKKTKVTILLSLWLLLPDLLFFVGVGLLNKINPLWVYK